MSEEMRKDFSKEYYRLSGCEVLFDDYGTPYIGGISGVIVNASVQSAWWGWKKSREATKPIKLPDFNVFIYYYCWFDGESEHVMEYFDVSECRNFLVEAIQQAGYKVE